MTDSLKERLRDLGKRFADAVHNIAFDMEPPNSFTPPPDRAWRRGKSTVKRSAWKP